MNDELNRKVAEVAGWEVAPKISPAVRAAGARCGHHKMLLHGNLCPDCFPDPPDYLAPENLHLLIELARSEPDYLKIEFLGGDCRIISNKGVVRFQRDKITVDAFPEALALAIVEGAA